MPMNINVGGSWKEGEPFINVGGTWKSVEAAWTNVGGSWKEFYKKEFVFNILSDRSKLTMDEVLAAAGDNDNIRIWIRPGLKIRAVDSAGGILVNRIPAGKKITLFNEGNIYGLGGDGGKGGDVTVARSSYAVGAGQPGKPGGPAIKVNSGLQGTFELINNGIIYGGGGGGGGGGAASYIPAQDYQTHFAYTGAGGGGGQTSKDNAGGSSGWAYNATSKLKIIRSASGYGGDFTGGAPGGQGRSTGVITAGNGGRGGSWGQPGAKGRNGSSTVSFGATIKTSNGGAGGAAGASIDGISRITVTKRGTLVGPTKN